MERKASNQNRRLGGIRPLSLLMLLMALAVTYATAVTALTPKKYDLKTGDIAQETITATRTIQDDAATNALRQTARNGVPDLYVIDTKLAKGYLDNAKAFFGALDDVRKTASDYRMDSSVPWESALTDLQKASLKSRTQPSLTGDQLIAVLGATDSEMLRLKELVLPKITTLLNNGLAEADVNRMRLACREELNATTLSDGLKQIGGTVTETCVNATYVVDGMATENAREQAAAAVEPVRIKQGQVIVEKGAAVTDTQLEVLRELELVRESASDLHLGLGIAAYFVVLYCVFGAVVAFFQRDVFDNNKKMVIIGVLVALTMLLALLFSTINSRITPALFAVMLTAILVSEHTAIAVSALMAFSIGLIAGGRGSSAFQFDALVMTVSSLVAGVVAVMALKRSNRRSAVIAAGLIGGAAGALAIGAIYVTVGRPALETLEDIGWALGSDALSGVLCVGTMSIWENAFDIATTARLSELSNTNHPLLKQMMAEAPGTYHHSLMVATLAEGAAQRIGADSALARVGAYYHDVGKLKRPLYFMENQRGENVHDTLPPAQSAADIIAHQKDGAALLTRHKLPSAIVQIAYEHHGNSLMTFFYHKAVQEAGGKNVPQKAFRYPGTRPSTRESAIVMLADSCEAAVRSLAPESTWEDVETMIHRVIADKMEDGQLNLAPLTLVQITEIERSFVRTLSGMRHERIEYPDQKKGS